jgi:hypothetical protein
MFIFPLTQASRKETILGETELNFIKSLAVKGFLENLRIVMDGPTSDNGGITH